MVAIKYIIKKKKNKNFGAFENHPGGLQTSTLSLIGAVRLGSVGHSKNPGVTFVQVIQIFVSYLVVKMYKSH